jgi:hypothetical protein
VPTDATRERMSTSHIGKQHSNSTKEKIGNANRNPSDVTRKRKSDGLRGKIRSEAHCKNISVALTGKKLSEATCKKFSILRTGSGNPFYNKRHTQETRDLISKTRLGKPLPPEVCLKMSISHCGENNINWKGGISYGKYCPKFDNRFKNGVRLLFDNTCMICGHKWQPGETKMAVHHVYYNKGSCCDMGEDGYYIHTLPEGERVRVIGDPNKFVPICPGKCHMKTNHNRLKWALLFEQMINDMFDGKSYYAHEELDAMQLAHIIPPAYHPKIDVEY